MNKINYDAEMERIVNGFKARGEKPTLLLHACCAPCSTACLDRVKDDFKVTVYFFNPNMDTEKEYTRRAEEEVRLCKELGVSAVIEKYEPTEFYSAVKGLENEKEGGARCEKCFYLRLNRTAKKAKADGYDFFTTTLTLSPLKNADLLNEIGKKTAQETGTKFLPSDFKKRDGYKKSIEMSKKYGLYRQNYCGCVFSQKERTEG